MKAAFQRGGIHWWLPDEVAPPEAVARVEAAIACLAAGAPNLKQGRRKQLYRLDLGTVGVADHLLKVNHYPRGRWRPSKARYELERAEQAAARGIATPVPLAAGEQRAFGRTRACYLLVALLPGTTDLREHLASASGELATPAARRRLAETFGRFARSLHDAGLHQDDFQPNNFLIRAHPDRAPKLWVIDFERARIAARGRGVALRARRRALAKLDREVHDASRALRARFLRAYAACDPEPDTLRRWWQRIAREACRLARRDHSHLRRNATRPGRRFVVARADGFVGLASPSVEQACLERAVAEASPHEVRALMEGDPPAWVVTLAHDGVGYTRTILARALVLAARGLAPTPLAVLRGEQASVLLLARPPRSVNLSEGEAHGDVAAARRLLVRRLEGYGRLRRRPRDDEIALLAGDAGRLRALLLGVEIWDVRRRFGGRGGSAARAR